MTQSLLELKQKKIQYIKGVGPKNSKKFKRLGINSVLDLLFYLPVDFENKRDIKKTTEAEIGETQSFILQIGDISSYTTRGGRKIYSAFAYDNYGSITLTWFHNPKYLFKKIDSEKYYFIYGKVQIYGREIQIAHPEIQEYEKGLQSLKSLMPVYPLTEGLTNNYIRKVVNNGLKLVEGLDDYYPKKFSKNNDLIELNKAFTKAHFPRDKKEFFKAKKRLSFDEFLTFNMIMEKRKNNRETIEKNPYNINYEKNKKFESKLPFKLTSAQKKAVKEIIEQLKKGKTMYRLLQGDVGSGKTVVAAYIIYITVYNQKQAAFMAPTTILASQHYEKLKKYLRPLDVNIQLLTGNTKKREKEDILNNLKQGEIDLLIGTHAMIYDGVDFHNLDLVLIDEQHKFGVEQRKILKSKGNNPHYIIMTATPIPRTTALVYFGDTDITTIDEMPEGRKEIKTGIRFEKDRMKMYKFLKKEVEKGNQVYVVYPLIDENEKMELKSAKKMYKEFVSHFGSEIVGLLHGRLKNDRKDLIMKKFRNNEIKILVSTTVIEVGVDSPNATVLIVEHPERFGLAQLHQLRGRVGRSDKQSYCILFVSNKINEETLKKLKKFAKTNDGFKIAKMDLEYRGSGKLLGKKQHGSLDFKIGDIFNDLDMFKKTKGLAEEIVSENIGNISYKKLKKIYFPEYDEN